MFCPVCQAEYRPGFYRCADCDVDLVERRPEGLRSNAQTQSPPEQYNALLWRGEDPHFYLALLGWLGRDVPSYGRPRYARQASESLASNDDAKPEFEVWVSESVLGRAKWILESVRQGYQQNWPGDRGQMSRDLRKREAAEPSRVCPLCSGEFPNASSLCPNCNVPLRLGRPDANEDTGARLLSDLAHPQFARELREALQSAHIPFNNANYASGDIVTGQYFVPNYNIAVMKADFARATELTARVLEHWEFEPAAGFRAGRKLEKTFWPRRGERNGWHPADLERLLWTGTNLSSLDAISMALREHQVPYRLDDSEPGPARIFVHPEDESGAREISAQVLEGIAPAEA